MSQFDLQTVDVDGAVRETAEGVDAHTREAFLRKAAIGGGTALTSGAIMSMLPAMADARPSKRQDIQILKFALTLEYLEAAFYKEAISKGALAEPVLQLAKLVNGHEQTHVSTLRQAIRSMGSKPQSEPDFDFRGTTENQDRFLSTSYVLENTGVRAYLGQASRLRSKALLNAAASIVTVESRHAAAFAAVINQTPFDEGDRSITPSGAFDRASSMGRILSNVRKLKFIKSS